MTVKLNLDAAGREYIKFPVTSLPVIGGPMEINFPPALTWVAMEWVTQNAVTGAWSVWDGVTGLPTHARILVSGPNAPAGASVVLAAGTSTTPKLRLTSAPEVIVRTSLAVIVVSSA